MHAPPNLPVWLILWLQLTHICLQLSRAAWEREQEADRNRSVSAAPPAPEPLPARALQSPEGRGSRATPVLSLVVEQGGPPKVAWGWPLLWWIGQVIGEAPW